MVAARKETPNPAFKTHFDERVANLPGPLTDKRKASFEQFMDLGIPTQRAELWKYTNLGRYVNQPMIAGEATDLPTEQVASAFAGGPSARRLIFVNGHFMEGLSHTGGLPEGVRVQSLDAALADGSTNVESHLAWQSSERSMTALNAALCDCGALIELDDGVAVDQTIQLLFLTSGGPSASMNHPRLIVRVGDNSSLKLIESHIGLGQETALTNMITQVDIGDNASLTHDRVQLQSSNSTIVSKMLTTLGKHTKLDLSTISLGGALIRNEHEVWVNGSQSDAILNGLYLPTGNEHVDNLIQIHHDAVGSRSEQLYKGVMRDKGVASFQGKIFVHKDAQQTNAYQTNNNLLLSDDATINSKPELEIYADDVKCSHGATCGDLDEQALFYLRSRGLDAASAESILTYAFLGEVLDRIDDPEIKKQAMSAVIDRLPGGGSLKGLL